MDQLKVIFNQVEIKIESLIQHFQSIVKVIFKALRFKVMKLKGQHNHREVKLYIEVYYAVNH